MLQKHQIEQFYEDLAALGLRFPIAEVARATGYSKGNVSEYINKKKPPPEAFLKSFYKGFKNVPQETLLEEPATDYIAIRRSLKNGDKPAVPVFGGFTTLGNIEVYDDENVKHKVVGHLPTEFFPNCDYAEKAKGDSMYPLIMNQALLVGRTCQANGITYGEKYIIKTKHGMDTTKYVHPGSEIGKIKLKAYNKSVPEQEVDVSDVVFVCRVYWIINPT